MSSPGKIWKNSLKQILAYKRAGSSTCQSMNRKKRSRRSNEQANRRRGNATEKRVIAKKLPAFKKWTLLLDITIMPTIYNVKLIYSGKLSLTIRKELNLFLARLQRTKENVNNSNPELLNSLVRYY